MSKSDYIIQNQMLLEDMKIPLTAQEKDFIASALNHYWNDATDQLINGGTISSCERRPLGDIESQMLKERTVIAKSLLMKIDK